MLYLFNQSETLVQIVPRAKVKSAIMTQELNQPEKLYCELTGLNLGEDIFYVGHLNPVNKKEIHLYKIIKTEVGNNGFHLDAVQTAHDDLMADGYLSDIRLYGATAAQALEKLLEGSRWSLGSVETQKNVHVNFYYCSRLEALKKLLGQGLEVRFRLAFSGQKIVGRYVDLAERFADDRGLRFAHGDKLLKVLKEENYGGIYTRLVGRGKGEQLEDEEGELTNKYGRRIMFADVEWSKSKGDPVDKPKGQEWVELPKMTERFGYPDGKARTGIVVFSDIEDPEELLKASYEHLVENSRPRVTYAASIINGKDAALGDFVRIIRDDLGIRYKTRIFKRELDLLAPEKVTVELGDQVKDYSVRRLEKIESKIQDLDNSTTDYVGQLVDRIGNLYWGEDGYNYDLEAGNAYGMPAGLYSYDRPIDRDPTKFIYFGAGKLIISNEKYSDGSWKLKTVMDGEGLGTGVVGARQILANSINATHIISGSITSREIAARTITAAEIAFGTITGDLIKAGSITANHIAAYTITSYEIASDAIQARHIAVGAVTADMITTGRIKARSGGSYFDLDTGYIYANSGYFSGTITASNISQSTMSAGNYYGTGYQMSSDGSIYTGHQEAYSFKYNSGSISSGVNIGSSITVSSTGIRMSVGYKTAVFERTGTAWLGIYSGNPDLASNILWCVDNNGQVHTGSDMRLKKNIVKADRQEAMNLIRDLKLYEFDYRSSGDHRVGVIADFFKFSKNKYAPLVYGKAAGDYLGVDYTLLSTIALGAVQDIDARLQKLEEVIHAKSA